MFVTLLTNVLDDIASSNANRLSVSNQALVFNSLNHLHGALIRVKNMVIFFILYDLMCIEIWNFSFCIRF